MDIDSPLPNSIILPLTDKLPLSCVVSAFSDNIPSILFEITPIISAKYSPTETRNLKEVKDVLNYNIIGM